MRFLKLHLTEGYEDFKPFYMYGEDGTIISEANGQIKTLKTPLSKGGGYRHFTPMKNDGTYEDVNVHQLIGAGFIEKPTVEDGEELKLMFINGNRADCRVENLKWATNSEIGKEALERTGSYPMVEKPVCHINAETNGIINIYNSAVECSRFTGVNEDVISSICHKHSKPVNKNDFIYVEDVNIVSRDELIRNMFEAINPITSEYINSLDSTHYHCSEGMFEVLKKKISKIVQGGAR